MGAQLDGGYRSSHQLNVRVLRFRVHPDREEPVLLAQDLIACGRADDAVGITDAALREDPADADLLLAHGLSWLGCDELGRAQRALMSAVRAAPGWAEPWRRLAELLILRRSYGRAADVVERGLAAAGDDAELCVIGREASRLHGLTERLGRFRRAPDTEDAALLAQHLLSLGRPDEAVEVTGRALECDSDDEDVLLVHGRILVARGELGAARECFSRLVELAPDFGEAWRCMGDVLWRLGELPAEPEDADGRVAVDRWVELMTTPPEEPATDPVLDLLDVLEQEMGTEAQTNGLEHECVAELPVAQTTMQDSVCEPELEVAIAAAEPPTQDTVADAANDVALSTDALEPAAEVEPSASDTLPGLGLSPRAAWALSTVEPHAPVSEAPRAEPAQGSRTSWVLRQGRPGARPYRPPAPRELRPRGHGIHNAMDRAWGYFTGR